MTKTPYAREPKRNHEQVDPQLQIMCSQNSFNRVLFNIVTLS